MRNLEKRLETKTHDRETRNKIVISESVNQVGNLETIQETLKQDQEPRNKTGNLETRQETLKQHKEPRNGQLEGGRMQG